MKLVYPLVWLSTRLTKHFKKKRGNEITREEIIALASLSHKSGSLFQQENEYLSNLLGLRDILTSQILTPRTVVHMFDQSTSVTEALNDPRTSEFTRMPIYQETPDDITGKVIKHDLFEAERNGHGDAPVSDYAKKSTAFQKNYPYNSCWNSFSNTAHTCSWSKMSLANPQAS